MTLDIEPPIAQLFHAYGRARDTPRHLAALGNGDEAMRKAAMKHLWAAIIHQGTACTATAPVAHQVAALLHDARLAGASLAPLRTELLEFLGSVGEAGTVPSSAGDLAAMRRANRASFYTEFLATYAELLEEARHDDEDDDEDDEPADDEELEVRAFEAIWGDTELADALHARAFVGCVLVAPALIGPVMACLDDADPQVTAAAAQAARKLVAAARVGPAVGGIPADEADRLAAEVIERLQRP